MVTAIERIAFILTKTYYDRSQPYRTIYTVSVRTD